MFICRYLYWWWNLFVIAKIYLSELLLSECRKLVKTSCVRFGLITIMQLNDCFFVKEYFLSINILEMGVIMNVKIWFPNLRLWKWFLWLMRSKIVSAKWNKSDGNNGVNKQFIGHWDTSNIVENKFIS